MKKSAIILFALLLAFVKFAGAQSVDEVLEKHFKAVGQDKLSEIESFYLKVNVSQMGMEMPMEMKSKKPDKFIINIDVQGQKMVQAFDGEKGWMIIPMRSPDPQELAGEQLEQVREQVDLEGDLYRYKEKGSTADLGGKVNIDGKDCYRIKLTTKDENVKDYFIDANTFLVSKVKSRVSAQGQTVDIEQIMTDYETFDGITMAKKIESKSPMGTAIINMEEIKFNEKFDDSIFKQPSK
jgi:outer membrane lipoprotein-sorting protein